MNSISAGSVESMSVEGMFVHQETLKDSVGKGENRNSLVGDLKYDVEGPGRAFAVIVQDWTGCVMMWGIAVVEA